MKNLLKEMEEKTLELYEALFILQTKPLEHIEARFGRDIEIKLSELNDLADKIHHEIHTKSQVDSVMREFDKWMNQFLPQD